MAAGICKLCLAQTELIEAHIIPRSFYRFELYDGEVPRIVSSKIGTYPKRSPIGIYDEKILCQPCDNKIGTYDHYAYELLLLNTSVFAKQLSDNGTLMALSTSEFNYKKLKLFFMTLLWRAHISGDDFFEKVNLGPFEDQLRQMILNEDPGDSQSFACVLSKFDPSPGVCIMNPVKGRFDVNIYQFYLADYLAYIKVDKRKLEEPFSRILIQDMKPLIILVRDFRKSREFDLMRFGIKKLEELGYL